MKRFLLIITAVVFGIQGIKADENLLITNINSEAIQSIDVAEIEEQLLQTRWSHSIGIALRQIDWNYNGYGINYSAYYGNELAKARLSGTLLATASSNIWSELGVGVRFEAYRFIPIVLKETFPSLYGEIHVGGAYLSGVNKFHLTTHISAGMDIPVSTKLSCFWELGAGIIRDDFKMNKYGNWKAPAKPSMIVTAGVRF